MKIYVVLESETKRFIEAYKSEEFAEQICKALNANKVLSADGHHYEFVEYLMS